jgi:CubicO group peptidase (beta-lactamase class C family)
MELAFLLALAAQDVAAPPEFKSVREFIEERVRAGNVPSLAVAVVREGNLVWAEGFGLADLEKKTPATSDSIYLLASVSKPMTATGLMVLKDRGLIDLDAPANRYLGEAGLRAYEGSADDMTVRRLANHTAGMPLHWNFWYEGTAPPSRDETIRRYGFAAWAPGSEWGYSNLAFGILDHITARVTKTPWREFMETTVYDPLRMARTSDRVRPGREADATAQYEPDREGRFVRVKPYTFDHPGASAIWSSANDLARFLRMHLLDGALDGARVLSEDSARAMRVQTSRRADGGGNGVGWAVGPLRGRPSFSHGGGMTGVTTFIAGFEENKHAIVVLSNSGRAGAVQETVGRIAAVLYPEVRAVRNPRAEPGGVKREDFAGKWKGKVVHYAGDVPLTLSVGERGVTAGWNGADHSLRDVGIRNGRMGGTFDAALRTDTAFSGIPSLRLEVRRQGDRLVGVLMAQAQAYFCLSHRVELDRAEE